MAHPPRSLWKGAISFGLVHIPVALYPATSDNTLDFDWLDKRGMDPVGYKRINKTTGKEIDKDDIVRGIAYEPAKYVVLTDDEIHAAYPRTTQTIEIESFVKADSIPFVYLDRPYYLAPVNKGEKVYALMREALLATGRIGLAKVVIQTKQHLAALVAVEPGLVLNLLRWGDEIRSWEALELPPEGAKAAGLKQRELDMARQLVEEMSGDWDPSAYTDSFRDRVMELVHQKVKAGQTEAVTQPRAEEEAAAGADVIDLTELLQRSLRHGAQAKPAPKRRRA
jgi:DNA end-binding protein Ku